MKVNQAESKKSNPPGLVLCMKLMKTWKKTPISLAFCSFDQTCDKSDKYVKTSMVL